MAVLQIGRVGGDSDISWDVRSVVCTGDDVSFSGDVVAGSVTDPAGRAAFIRDQIRGLANNPDEPVVPVVWSEDPSLNGFYRVVSASCDSTPQAAVGGSWTWTVDLTRVTASSAPLFESMLIYGGPIPHGWGAYTDTSCSQWIPSTTFSYYGDSGGSTWSLDTAGRTLDSGAIMYRARPGATSSGAVASTRNLWSAPVSDWLDGAATIEVEVSSGVWRPLVGRHMPLDYFATGWRLTNGTLRVQPVSGGAFRISGYDSGSTSWDAINFTISGNTHVGAVTGVEMVTVLRNAPEEVVVRCWVATASGSTRVVTVDVGLRRGDRLATFTCATSDYLNNEMWRAARTSTEAASTVSSAGVVVGIRATSNDANGNRFVMTSDYATTRDLVNGRLTCPSTTFQTTRFGLGMEIGGSSASGADTAQVLIDVWLSQPSETTRVAAR